jgi:glutaminyl-peptide cyclotransferase
MKRPIALLLALLAGSAAQAETRWTLVRSYPHDPRAFTEGLFYLDGVLYESTGINGQSQIRKVRLKDGKPIKTASLSPLYFGEGIVNWDGEIISVTWQNGIGFRWNRTTMMPTSTFSYKGEGWGMTQDGKRLILSDGTDKLRFFDPATMQQTGTLAVTMNGKPVPLLNELEYVKGEILANVWLSDVILRIDPATGKVIDQIDIGPLVRRIAVTDPDAVANGIAYDPVRDRLFITGKYWPKLYEIRLKR